MMYGWGNSGAGSVGPWIGMGLMMFFGLLVLAGIVLLIVVLARQSHSGQDRPHGTTAACDIAKQRLARGEITKDEYYDICRTVGG